jgi:hypothetical protein
MTTMVRVLFFQVNPTEEVDEDLVYNGTQQRKNCANDKQIIVIEYGNYFLT